MCFPFAVADFRLDFHIDSYIDLSGKSAENLKSKLAHKMERNKEKTTIK